MAEGDPEIAKAEAAARLENASKAPAVPSPRCGFCGKARTEVRVMIQGQPTGLLAAYICDECVDVCCNVVADYWRAHPETAPPSLLEEREKAEGR